MAPAREFGEGESVAGCEGGACFACCGCAADIFFAVVVGSDLLRLCGCADVGFGLGEVEVEAGGAERVTFGVGAYPCPAFSGIGAVLTVLGVIWLWEVEEG